MAEGSVPRRRRFWYADHRLSQPLGPGGEVALLLPGVLWDGIGSDGGFGGSPTQTIVEYRFMERPRHVPRIPKWHDRFEQRKGKPAKHMLLNEECFS